MHKFLLGGFMNMRSIIFMLAAALLFLPLQPLCAQSYKAQREKENTLLEAVGSYTDGDYAKAKKILKGLVSAPDADPAAYYYLGLTEFMLADYDLSEEALKEAARRDTTNFWYRYRLAGLYSVTGRPELTESIYEALLRDFPKKSDIYYNLIELYMAQGKMNEALETLDQIETVFGKSDAIAMTRFDILLRLERQREAYESLEAYNKEYSSPQVLAVLGDYQMSMYNDSTALAFYDEALDIAPDYAPAVLGKAETFRITRKYDRYFETMDQFVQDKNISPVGKSDYLKAIVQRSDPNFLQTFRPQLDSIMEKGVAAHPKDSSMMTVAGIYYYGSSRGEKAKEYFRENAENWPESISAAATYAEVLMYLHEWETLSSYAVASYDRFPSEPSFLELAVLADYNLKDYDRVLAVCERILAVSPGDTARVVSAYTTIGDIYHIEGDNAKAYKAYDKALKINPDHLPVLNNYAYYLSVEGKKLKKAYAMSRKTIEKEPDNPTYLDTFGWILYLQGKPLEAKPFFKHAMLYGGKDSAVILDHYAEVLYALEEYDLAFVYWNQAMSRNEDKVEGLEQKIKERKAAMKKK